MAKKKISNNKLILGVLIVLFIVSYKSGSFLGSLVCTSQEPSSIESYQTYFENKDYVCRIDYGELDQPDILICSNYADSCTLTPSSRCKINSIFVFGGEFPNNTSATNLCDYMATLFPEGFDVENSYYKGVEYFTTDDPYVDLDMWFCSKDKDFILFPIDSQNYEYNSLTQEELLQSYVDDNYNCVDDGKNGSGGNGLFGDIATNYYVVFGGIILFIFLIIFL